MKIPSTLRTALCLLILGGVIAGCSNTWRGVGEDTEHAGQKIEDSSHD